MRTVTLVCFVPGLVGWPALAADQVGQGKSEGLTLARVWCSGCHVVEPGVRASDAAPPFGAVANDPKSARARIEGWIHAPHPPMPQLNLSRPDIGAINDYIESLKRR